MLGSVCAQCTQTKWDFSGPSKKSKDRGEKITLGLKKQCILESFTSLSSEFIIPWSNASIKWGFFNMPVRHAAPGHLSFGRSRHRGVSKAAQNLAWDFLPLWIYIFVKEGRSGVCCFSVLWLLSVSFFVVVVLCCDQWPSAISLRVQ